jgi:hypothetical protein
MNLNDDQFTEIFFQIDEFCLGFEPELLKMSLMVDNSKIYKARKPKMSYSEVMTILVAFHLSGARCLKHYYLNYIQKHLSHLFPQTYSYNRFVEVQSKVFLPLAFFLQAHGLGQCSGISFIDSTPVRVCKNKRIKNNRVFKNIAKVGKGTMGWFFGFKLHLVINEVGEVLNFALTKGNCDDRDLKAILPLSKKLFGKLFGDKGYISKKLFAWLYSDGIHLITGIRNNMKNQLMTISDKILLRKRSVIETVNDELKNICQIEHSRHRSPLNFIVNMVAGLIAYNFLPKKPCIKLDFDWATPTLALQISSN